MPQNWNPFDPDFYSQENWSGSQGQKPWQIDPRAQAYGTGTGGANMQALLERQARGEGPSLGQGMMQQGLQQSIKNQRAQAAGMMGTNPALAMKLSGEQAGAATAQNLRDVGQVGLQEQMGAQRALQQWIQQERAAQMQLDQQRMFQRNLYQQRLMGWDPATEGIAGDVGSMIGSGLAMGAGAGWFGGGGQNQQGGGGSGVGFGDYRNPNWGF